MQKYLDYIITEVLKIEEKEVSERLIIELNLYKEYWEINIYYITQYRGY